MAGPAGELRLRLHDLGFRDVSEESLAHLLQCDAQSASAEWMNAVVRRMRLELAKLEQYKSRTTRRVGDINEPLDHSVSASVAFLRRRGVLIREEDSAFDVLETMVALLQAERLRVARAAALEALSEHTKPVLPPTGEDAAAAEFRAELLQLSALLNLPHESSESDESISSRIAAELEKRRAAKTSGPIFSRVTSTPAQMRRLAEINDVLRRDFALRRKMLLQRVDVTITSFLWSARGASHEEEIRQALAPLRDTLEATAPLITTDDIFRANDALVRSTTLKVSAAVTSSAARGVKSVLMGAVPDRGGRPEDRRPKKESMPGWSKRRQGGGRGRGARGRGRAGKQDKKQRKKKKKKHGQGAQSTTGGGKKWRQT